VSDISGKLSDKIEMSELVWRAFFWLLAKSEGKRLVIRVDYESASFYHVSEVFDRKVDG